ncbi:ROK family protein [Candidatus Uhrbacteria bacterium]|nr:ROK family protein [Candidatus Uhrbacteria bacterium]
MILGVDIGGTKIAAGLVSNRGEVVSWKTVRTRRTRATLLAGLKKLIAAHMRRGIRAIGIGIAGQVDIRRGVFLHGPNLPLKNLPLAQLLKKQFNIPVVVDNDVHCFTLAEATYGAGRRYESVFGVMLGTGIGGGFVRGRALVHGATNTAAEIGHTVILRGSRVRCSCGKPGHLEALAGGRGLERRYRMRTGKTADARRIETLYRAGNKTAVRIVKDAQQALAIGFSTVLVSFDPNCVVVGGGLARFHGLWQPAVRQARALLPFARLRKTPIIPSKLGDAAVMIGAALLAQEKKS